MMDFTFLSASQSSSCWTVVVKDADSDVCCLEKPTPAPISIQFFVHSYLKRNITEKIVVLCLLFLLPS